MTRPAIAETRTTAGADADGAVAARRLGTAAGALVQDPVALADSLRAGLAGLADPAYRAGVEHLAPGVGSILGVRQPLVRAAAQGLLGATRRDRASTVLDVAAALLRADALELHWIAFALLERTIALDPERTWQLARAAARDADAWITVDALARVAARGILAEPYRWAELEQLVYSPSRWERRLVGSTIAVVASPRRAAGRRDDIVRHGLGLVGDLLGDAAPEVQRSLSWALRSLATLDPEAVAALLRAEANAARTADDGNRAWVVRDTLEKLPSPLAAELRMTLEGVRRRPHAASTSRAAATAATFMGLGVDVPPAERPIVERP